MIIFYNDSIINYFNWKLFFQIKINKSRTGHCRTSMSIVLFYTRRLLIFPPWVTTTYNTFRRPFSTVWFIHFCYKVLRSFFTICKVLMNNLNLLKYYKSNDSVETRDIIINNIVISIRSPLVRIIHYFIIKQNNI